MKTAEEMRKITDEVMEEKRQRRLANSKSFVDAIGEWIEEAAKSGRTNLTIMGGRMLDENVDPAYIFEELTKYGYRVTRQYGDIRIYW